MVLKKWIKNIQTAGYNGARTVVKGVGVLATVVPTLRITLGTTLAGHAVHITFLKIRLRATYTWISEYD
jgi:hypothetical protein